MFPRRSIPRAGFLIAVLAVGLAVAADGPRLVSPKIGDMLLGPTTVRVAPDHSDGPVDRVDIYVNGALVGEAEGPQWSVRFEAGADEQRFVILAVAFSGNRVTGKTRREFRGASIDEYERVDLVQLYPVVLTPGGEYETGLTQTDFIVFEDGAEVPLEYFATEVLSLSIVLLLDVSESMSGKLGQLQIAADNFVSALGQHDLVSLYAFDHASRELASLTTDRQAVRDKIWELSPGGGTALYDAILRVIGKSLGHVSGRKVVFVFSDGMDQHSFSSLERVLQAARENNVLFYTVGTGEDIGSTEAREDLSALAVQTSGQAYFIRNASQLDGVFESILVDLRSQYVLSYRPPEGPAGMRSIKLKIVGGRYGTEMRDTLAQHAEGNAATYQVRHRRSYFYAPSPQTGDGAP